MNYYAKLVIVLLLVIGLAQVMPEVVNTLLILVLLSMLIMQGETFARLLASLKL